MSLGAVHPDLAVGTRQGLNLQVRLLASSAVVGRMSYDSQKIQLGLSLEKRVLFNGYLVFVLALFADGDWPRGCS